ncbi:MAG: potassium channel family protein [Devosia sp.]
MLLNLGLGLLVISFTVLIHTYGLIAVTHMMGRVTSHWRLQGRHNRIIAMNSVVIGIFGVITVEVWLWAMIYYLLRVMPDFQTALYFSTSTFSTVGYGDVVLNHDWRLLAALESIDGFILIGWSTAYLISAGMRVGPFRSGEHF